MSFETKVILKLLANQAVIAKSPRQVFEIIRSAANVEGAIVPNYDTLRAQLVCENEEKSDL